MALLEAMACGLPCVASRLPGSTETIVEDGASGLLLPPGDVEAFADGIARVLTQPSLAATLGTAAREAVVRQFSNISTADLWLSAYQRVSKARG